MGLKEGGKIIREGPNANAIAERAVICILPMRTAVHNPPIEAGDQDPRQDGCLLSPQGVQIVGPLIDVARPEDRGGEKK